ncbi:MAG: RNA 2'-phosphotransferase [Candidatus Eremiobacteraeota bacterium]|nr:RNA 2'-phosphotransferase [Candidatus Eremiobacteraeota bacterium]
MDSKKLKSKSKLLSLILRHKPETVGLTLDPQGWVEIETLLQALTLHRKGMSRATLDLVVAENDKARFSISEDGQRIRAVQGHSLSVDLELRRASPPSSLFHGTVARFLDKILSEGLKPMARHHVHLSADRHTAFKVGSRRGSAVILEIDAKAMVAQEREFFLSENGVWLTDSVEPEFLRVHENR